MPGNGFKRIDTPYTMKNYLLTLTRFINAVIKDTLEPSKIKEIAPFIKEMGMTVRQMDQASEADEIRNLLSEFSPEKILTARKTELLEFSKKAGKLGIKPEEADFDEYEEEY